MVFVRVPVNEKGQIVIPKALRDAYGIRPGEDILVGERENGLVIERPLSAAAFVKELEAFPKLGRVKVDSDKDYAEALESR